MLELGEWVIVILAAAVVTAIAVGVGYVLNISWLMGSAWLLGIAAAGLIIYATHRSDES